MTEKRYYAHKHLFRENKVHDTICPKFMNINETVEHMNGQYQKYKQLKKENEKLTKALLFFMDVTYVETSSNWYESMDAACQKIFEKSYDEIHKIYKEIETDEDVFKLFEGDME